MAPKASKKEDWEDLVVDSDTKLPASHIIFFVLDAMAMSVVPGYLFSAIFDINVQENYPIFIVLSVVVFALVFLACQKRSKGIRNRLLKSRGVELESIAQRKQTQETGDNKIKSKHKDAEKKRSEINAEALSLTLAYTNAIFMTLVVFLAFWVLRASSPLVSFGASSILSAVVVYLI